VSKLLVEVTISCCTVLLLYCSLLHYISVTSGFLSTWIGLLSDRVGLVSNGVGLFSGERILENMPTPLFKLPLKFIAHGRIFESLQYLVYFSWSVNEVEGGKVMESLHTDTRTIL